MRVPRRIVAVPVALLAAAVTLLGVELQWRDLPLDLKRTATPVLSLVFVVLCVVLPLLAGLLAARLVVGWFRTSGLQLHGLPSPYAPSQDLKFRGTGFPELIACIVIAATAIGVVLLMCNCCTGVTNDLRLDSLLVVLLGLIVAGFWRFCYLLAKPPKWLSRAVVIFMLICLALCACWAFH